MVKTSMQTCNWDLFIHVIIAAGFSCGPVYVMSKCPEEFFPCFPKELVCNLAADCPRGIDEINCTDYGIMINYGHFWS